MMLWWSIFAQAAELVVLTPAQQQADFDQLWGILDEWHPSTTLYTPPEELERIRDDVRSRLDEERPSLAFWALLQESVSAIGCGHTNVSFGTNEVVPIAASQQLPALDLVVLRDGLYRDPRSEGPRGRVVSIQGVPAGELLTSLRKLTGGDGLSTGSADMRIDRYGPLLLGALLGGHDVWRVVLEQDGVEEEHLVRGEHYFRGTSGSEPQPADDDRYLVEVVDLTTGQRFPARDGAEGRAVLLSFDEFPRPGKLKRKIIRPLLRALEQDPAGVIVDLRHNGGGDPFAAMDLYGHFIDAPVPSYSKRMFNDRSYADGNWKDGVRDVSGLMDVGYGDEATIVPLAPHYDGPLIVLTSADSFSTAADFAAFAKRDGRGTIVGQPTGGSATIQTSGAAYLDTLEHSGLEYAAPLSRSVLADPEGVLADSVGVQPDVPVAWTLESLEERRDVDLQAALEVLRAVGDGGPAR